MATINLTIKADQQGAVAHRIRYSRVDNTFTPTWVTVSPDVVNSPNLTQTIATNIPNGQYTIGYKALYADLRECPEQFVQTAVCPSMLSITAYLDGSNIIVQYLGPSVAPKVRITVNYPNGGSYIANYVNNGNDIAIALPSNVYGVYNVSAQAVCDEQSGFYSPSSSQVSINRPNETVNVWNQSSVLTITNVEGIAGYTLSSSIAPGAINKGSHDAFIGLIDVTLTTSGVFTGHRAMLVLNGTMIQCVDITSGSVTFNGASYAQTDTISIIVAIGTCV